MNGDYSSCSMELNCKKKFDGFLIYNSRMIDCLEDFACVLATEKAANPVRGL